MPILIGLFIGYRWGLHELGAFTVASATLAVALVVTDWGTTRALPRNLATLPHGMAVEFLSSANTFRLLLFAAVVALSAVAAVLGSWDRGVTTYMAILLPVCVFSMLTTNALSDRVVTGEMVGVGFAVMAGVLTFAALGAAFMRLALPPWSLAAAYACGKLVEAVVMTWGRWWVARMGIRSMSTTAALLWPFGVHLMLAAAYSRLSVFTVERMTDPISLGVFSVAVALHAALLLVPTSLALLHFPEITRAVQSGAGGRVRSILIRYSIFSCGTVGAGLIALGVLAPRIGRVLNVPPQFSSFLVAFAAISLITVFSSMAGFVMQARGREKEAARLAAWMLVVGVAYQLVALRVFGLWGICIAVTAGEITTVVSYILILRGKKNSRP
jgi:O-antigen/teichoic acid export membrane protein